jgi:hypothetical protein
MRSLREMYKMKEWVGGYVYPFTCISETNSMEQSPSWETNIRSSNIYYVDNVGHNTLL